MLGTELVLVLLIVVLAITGSTVSGSEEDELVSSESLEQEVVAL
jgi:hypothetical protein